MYVNNELVMLELYSFKGTYLISLLLLHLDWNIVSTPEPIGLQIVIERDIRYVHVISYIWDSYQHQPKLKSLLTLCIQQTRKHMSSLTDSSFMSLPVPSCIRRLLKHLDIADVLCEAWRHGPDCSPGHK